MGLWLGRGAIYPLQRLFAVGLSNRVPVVSILIRFRCWHMNIPHIHYPVAYHRLYIYPLNALAATSMLSTHRRRFEGTLSDMADRLCSIYIGGFHPGAQ